MVQSKIFRSFAVPLASFFLAGTAAAQDPVVVNASSTVLKLENDRVRVYETTLAPGEKEEPHTHRASTIYVVSGGKLRLHNPDGTSSEAVLETGTAFFREPITHWTQNIGDTTFKVLLVEVKSAEEAKAFREAQAAKTAN